MVRPVRTTVPAGAGNDQEVFGGVELCNRYLSSPFLATDKCHSIGSNGERLFKYNGEKLGRRYDPSAELSP